MHLSVNQMMDFLTCPVLYKFRHIDQVDASITSKHKRPNKQSIIEMYDQALHKAIAYLFHTVQNGTYPGLHHLSTKWGYLWVKPRADQEDLRFKQTSWRDTHERKRTQGWERLTDVWSHYRDTSFTPIMVDYHYRIPVGRHTLEGSIDLVRVVKDKNNREYIEMVEFVTDERNAPFLHIRRDWRVTAAALAFRKTMNVKEEKIVYHGIISGKITETKRSEDDFEQLEYLLDSIEQATQEGIFYPVFNERCLTCPYEKHCEKGWYHVKDSNGRR